MYIIDGRVCDPGFHALRVCQIDSPTLSLSLALYLSIYIISFPPLSDDCGNI